MAKNKDNNEPAVNIISTITSSIDSKTGMPNREYIIKSSEPEIETFIPYMDQDGKLIYKLQDKDNRNNMYVNKEKQ